MIYDISPPISEATAVWPGDIVFSRCWQLQIDQGANIDLSSIQSTVHIGAHADAPSHYTKGGDSIDKVDLTSYLGECLVVRVKGKEGLIRWADCKDYIDNGVKRILFCTASFPDPDKFNQDFTAFHPDTIEQLGKAGIILIGIDTPSFDPFDSKDLPSHHSLARYGIRNLEGLVLDHVPTGKYELIALPLKLKGCDASPVRAVLRKNKVL